MLKNLKIKKKFWNIFFCLQFSCTFCEVIAEHFKKRAKCFKKMPNWRQKRQNGGRQLKVCCHYKIIKLLALINALDSYSKSKFDPKWLHLALNVSSKHSVPKKMRYPPCFTMSNRFLSKCSDRMQKFRWTNMDWFGLRRQNNRFKRTA